MSASTVILLANIALATQVPVEHSTSSLPSADQSTTEEMPQTLSWALVAGAGCFGLGAGLILGGAVVGATYAAGYLDAGGSILNISKPYSIALMGTLVLLPVLALAGETLGVWLASLNHPTKARAVATLTAPATTVLGLLGLAGIAWVALQPFNDDAAPLLSLAALAVAAATLVVPPFVGGWAGSFIESEESALSEESPTDE